MAEGTEVNSIKPSTSSVHRLLTLPVVKRAQSAPLGSTHREQNEGGALKGCSMWAGCVGAQGQLTHQTGSVRGSSQDSPRSSSRTRV